MFDFSPKRLKASLSKVFWVFSVTGINIKILSIGAILAVFLIFSNFFLLSLLFPIVNLVLKRDLATIENLGYLRDLIYKIGFQDSFWKILLLLGGALYFTVVFRSLINFLSFYSSNLQTAVASNKMRDLLFRRYLSFGKLFFDNQNKNELNRILIESGSTIGGSLSSLNKIAIDVITFIAYFSYLLYVSWKLTIIVVPLLFLLYLFLRKIKNNVNRLHLEKETARINFSNKISDLIACLVLVKGFGREEKERSDFEIESKKEVDVDIKIQKKFHLLTPIEEIASMTIVLSVAGIIAMMSFYDNALSISGAVIFVFILSRIPSLISSIQSGQAHLIELGIRLGQIQELLSDEDKFIFKGGEIEFGGLKDKIEIKNLKFAYKENEVLRGIFTDFKKGEKIAIVGKTGSGKSTLVNILLRFYDCPADSVFIDGVDIKKYSLESLKKHFAFMTQDVYLFNNTIKNNLLYSLDEDKINKEHVDFIIDKLDLMDFIKKFPEEMDYQVGNNGGKLSGGEKQRVSLARTLIKDSSIIVLDEPTGSLDSKTEKTLVTGLEEIAKNKTVIIIAHRLSTIMNSDKVIVMENGLIVEQGAPKELVEKKGYFYKYYEHH